MRPGPARVALAAGTLVAGAGMLVGPQLPWLSMFAGLAPVAAVDGLYGRLLVVLGGLTVLAGATLLWRETLVGRWVHLVAALAALVLSGWVLVQVESTLAALAADPLLVAGRGPGAWVTVLAAAAALVLALVPIPRAQPDTAAHASRRSAPGSRSR